jgi:hypothetical protein
MRPMRPKPLMPILMVMGESPEDEKFGSAGILGDSREGVVSGRFQRLSWLKM